MSISSLECKVIHWAGDRGIFDKSTPSTQMLKSTEELGELAGAIARRDLAGIKEELGDVMVTLILQAHMHGLSATECLQYAYEKIADRKGEMKNGVFVKNE